MKRARAFTLIELLVVIAIIMLLAALLMPALHSARTTAKKIVCQSDLRQVWIASMAYSANYGGVILPCLIYTGPYYGYTWGGLLYPTYLPDLGTLHAGSPFYCPEDTEILNNSFWSNDYFSWGYNPYLNNVSENFGSSPPPIGQITSIPNPSSKLYFGDHISYAFFSWEVPPAQNYDYRHAGGSNLNFLDGHVEWWRSPLPNYGTSPPW